jgi:C_GCAxxG_C_C family probable redox protein
MTEIAERAVATYQEGFACSQSVLSAFASELGMPIELAFKVAAPFAGGIARQGEMCGAVTGALMVIGLQSGNITGQDQIAKDWTYESVREFIARFKERNGSILCRELLNCDISNPQELQRARDTKLFANICPGLIRASVEIVASL